MGHELICNWLGIQPAEWPPDHYRLLGLQPGECDAALIEKCVHSRLDSVRCYQMLHPEQATEAMNRLAQAFVCLTEPNAKRQYDAILLGASTAMNGEQAGVVTLEAPPESLELLEPPASGSPRSSVSPPPLPSAVDTLTEIPAAGSTESADVPMPPPLPPLPEIAPPAPPPAPAEPIDPVIEAAQASREARRGLGTKRALYHRIARTRKLIRAWDRVGEYLTVAKRRVLRRAEVRDLLARLDVVSDLLARFPPLMGEAGQPGYLVLQLSQVEPARLGKMSEGELETLGNDWKAGFRLLIAHREFLRQEVRALRTRSFRDRLVLAGRSILNDHPGATLLVVAAVAVVISLWRTH